MAKSIIGRERAVEALAGLCKDYRMVALRAIREGKEEVFVPVNPDQEMVKAIRNPEGLLQFVSQNENQSQEPVYASREEFLQGRNADGTPHAGYAQIDIIAKLITDVCMRNGLSVVSKIRPLDAGTLVRELTGKPGSYCF